MTGICGWAATTPATAGADSESSSTVLDRMIQSLCTVDQASVSAKTLETGALACGERPDPRLHQDSQSGTLAHIQGLCRWLDPELRDLAKAQNDAAALIAGYLRLGPNVLTKLHGHFVVALVADQGQTALIATDRLGTRPLCYMNSGDGIVFASRNDACFQYPGLNPKLREQAIYNYVYLHMVPSPNGAWEDVKLLKPGQYLHLKDGKQTLGTYYQTEYTDTAGDNFDELKATFRGLLDKSVEDLLDDSRKVGGFLSGGTDSSTLVGTLGKLTGEAAPCYSIGFDAPDFDETEYARIAAKAYGAQHEAYYIKPEDIVDAIPRIARFYDAPFGNSSAVPAYFCAKLAKDDGIDLILGGDGGDELFGGNERYATQQVFDAYHHFPGFLRKGLLEPALNTFPLGERIWPIRKGRRYVEQANVPMPDRIQAYNILVRLGNESVFTPEFLSRINTEEPLNLQREVYQGAHSNSDLNRHLALDMKFTLADNDLPKVGGVCEIAGMNVAYPLLDDRLVDFAAALPDELKVNKLKLRWFFKEALKDFLPDEIINKTKHGFGLPFGLWIEQHAPLRELVDHSLGNLKQRGIIAPAFIDQLNGDLMKEHASYYGVSIWILVILEQWLEAHGQ